MHVNVCNTKAVCEYHKMMSRKGVVGLFRRDITLIVSLGLTCQHPQFRSLSRIDCVNNSDDTLLYNKKYISFSIAIDSSSENIFIKKMK